MDKELKKGDWLISEDNQGRYTIVELGRGVIAERIVTIGDARLIRQTKKLLIIHVRTVLANLYKDWERYREAMRHAPIKDSKEERHQLVLDNTPSSVKIIAEAMNRKPEEITVSFLESMVKGESE